MRRVSVLGISLLALAVVAWPRASAAQDNKTARGTVTAMAGSSLTVRVGANEMKFTVDPQATVVASGAGTKERKSEGAGVKLGDVIKTGQAVVVTYREKGATLLASRVEAVSSAGGGGGAVSAPAPATKTSSGTVKSVAASSLTITADGKDMTFAVDGSTNVVAKGASTKAGPGGKIAITDVVKSGSRVSVSYHETGATMHAAEVRVVQ